MSEKNLPSNESEAQEEINKLVARAYDAINQAEALADKFGISFSLDVAYGMGGTYDPEEGEWMSSSESC